MYQPNQLAVSSVADNSFFNLHVHNIQSELQFQKMSTRELKQWLIRRNQKLPVQDRLKQYYVDRAVAYFRSQNKNTSLQLRIHNQNSNGNCNETDIKMKDVEICKQNQNLKLQNEQLSIRSQCLETEIRQLRHDKEQTQHIISKYADSQKQYQQAQELIQQLLDQQNSLNIKNKQLERNIREQQIKTSNVEEKYRQLEKRYQSLLLTHNSTEIAVNKLQKKYKELEIKYNCKMKESDYRLWDAKYIANWIVNFDRLRYKKYFDILLQRMIDEGIDGTDLLQLDKNDLHRLGISQFKDKTDIYKKIQQWFQNRQEDQNKKINYHKHEGLQNDTDYL
eukprot:362550_1